LEITEIRCTRCDTHVHAHYRPCDFCALTEEQTTFLRLFVTSRGNLSEVEKRLGVSYPTIRAKLDEVIERLASTTQPPASPAPLERRAILEAIAQGSMNAAEGMRRIRELKGQP
jgi:hypothetical protein